MAPLTSTNNDVNMILSQMQGVFGQIGSSMGGDSSSYINCIFTAGNDIQGLTSGDEQQKASAIQGLLNNAMSLINKLASKEASAASKEVKDNSEEGRKLNDEIQKSRSQLEQEMNQISGEITTQTGIVNTSVETLEKAQADIEKKQEEINAIIQQIQEKQAQLAQTTDPAEQAKILSQIQSLSGNISTVVSSIGDIQETVETASSDVESAVANIETARGNAVDIQQTGESRVMTLTKNASDLTVKNATSNTTGVINNATGDAAQAAADGASASSSITFGLTGGAAAKLYQVAFDQHSAGTTRLTGSISNLNSLLQGIGGLNDNASLLTHFKNSIGTALEGFDTGVGAWNTALDPVITSFGSFSTIEDQNATLQATVKEDLSSLPEDAQAAGQWAALTPEQYDFGQGSVEEGEEDKKENISGLKTPDVELTIIENVQA